MPKHLIQDRGIEIILGFLLGIAGLYLLWDAYNNRGKNMIWPLSGLAPFQMSPDAMGDAILDAVTTVGVAVGIIFGVKTHGKVKKVKENQENGTKDEAT